MSAVISVYWPGISEEQISLQPGFYNDYKAWSDWIIVREKEPNVRAAIRRLNAGAILTATASEVNDDHVDWVTPAELREAALRLVDSVQAGGPDIETVLDSYEEAANEINPVAEEFIQDLHDIARMATWAEDQGAFKMTLKVYW